MKNLPPYTFGCEIECFGVNPAVVAWDLRRNGITVADLVSVGEERTPEHVRAANCGYDANTWVIGEDCSIRGNHPMEIKSPVLKGNAGLKMVRKVLSRLKFLGAKVNKTTGLHVHVGVYGADEAFTVGNVMEILRRWSDHHATVESLVHWTRRTGKNRYVVPVAGRLRRLDEMLDESPLVTCEPFPPGWENMDTYQRADFNRYGYGDYRWRDGRYRTWSQPIAISSASPIEKSFGNYGDHFDAVSISPLTKYGTIEFRQHHGSLHAAEVCNWIQFVLNHVSLSRKLSNAKTQGKRARGRKPGLFTGLPINVRSHFKKQAKKFADEGVEVGAY